MAIPGPQANGEQLNMRIQPQRLLTDFRHSLVSLAAGAGELVALGLLHGSVLHWTQLGVAVAGVVVTALVPNVPATQTAPPGPVVGVAGP